MSTNIQSFFSLTGNGVCVMIVGSLLYILIRSAVCQNEISELFFLDLYDSWAALRIPPSPLSRERDERVGGVSSILFVMVDVQWSSRLPGMFNTAPVPLGVLRWVLLVGPGYHPCTSVLYDFQFLDVPFLASLVPDGACKTLIRR